MSRLLPVRHNKPSKSRTVPSARHLAIACLAALPAAIAHAQETLTQWDCRADGNGGWQCNGTKVDTSTPRPTRSSPVRKTPPTEKPASDEPRLAAVRNLDWVDESAMTDEQRAALPRNCCGAYIEPARNYPDAELDPEQASLRVTANSTEMQTDNIAVLEGDVQVSQGYRQVRADRAQLDQTNRRVVLEGDVQFREPGTLLIGQKADVDIDSKEISIDDAVYVLHQSSVRGTAANLSRNRDGFIVIDDATYSTCEPGDGTWQLVTDEINIDETSGFATVKNARLDVGDIPVFYFPWARFPIDDRRSSGLLFPLISLNKKNGLDLAQPIYWNIAPNYDATITPRYIEKRGVGVELEARHLNNWAETTLGGAFLGQDDGGDPDNKYADPITGLNPHEGDDRYLMMMDHLGGMGQPWSTYVDFTEVSDRDYFRDLGNLTLEVNSRSHLRRVAGASWRNDNWLYQVEGEHYQILSRQLSDQYWVLPRITANGFYRYSNGVELELDHQLSQFDHDDPGHITGRRAIADYSLSWDKRWVWGYFRPQIRNRYLSYDLDDEYLPLADSQPDANIPVFSIDSGLFFERDTLWSEDLLQTLEPRLYYVHAQFDDQSGLPNFDTRELTPSYNLLFRDNRFSGGDRISDEHKITLGLTSRFIDKTTGQERFRASLAQAIYLDDRRITLSDQPDTDELNELSRNSSPLALDLSARIGKNWTLNSEVVYDLYDNQQEKTSIGGRYKDASNRIYNATYRYTRRLPRQFDGDTLDQDIEQSDLSAFLPLSGNYNLVARWNHDLTNNRELDLFAGFEYNSCCWRASLVVRRWLDRNDRELLPEENLDFNNGIFIQIQFKGLSGTGNRVDSILKHGIYGYEPLEDF